MIYKLKTPNHLYSGVTEGVPFSQGVGHTDEKNTRNVLVNDYGYKDITDYNDMNDTTKEAGETTTESAKETSEALQEFSEGAEEPEGTVSDKGEFSGNLNVEDINIEDLTVPQLKEIAGQLDLSNYSRLTKDELIELITNAKNADA